jgi:hypothetical protein
LTCPPRADFIAKIGTLNVEFADEVTVNGIVWKPFPTKPKLFSVVNDALLEGFVLQITFYRVGSLAKGMLVVGALSDDVLQCGDALRLEGRYGR